MSPVRFETRPLKVPDKYYLWMNLTAREKEVALLIARYKSNPEIAQELGISPHTVANHLQHIYGKLELNSRIELASAVSDIVAYSDDAPT